MGKRVRLVKEKVVQKAKAIKEKTVQHARKVKDKISSVRESFNRKDVAQMLTSLFVIIQVYAFKSVFFGLDKSLTIFVISITTSAIILWIIAGRKEMLKHLVAGIIIVLILALISGYALGIKLEGMVIAAATALPVATMVDLLKK